ncbi:MAG TPA: BTAD domain-containing putative transcriptional regulator, partial [Acidimicrobiia bacterium]|nr:BTAD domain-containing putative transcriptional regulator [Acidimicrobiia bacterium]
MVLLASDVRFTILGALGVTVDREQLAIGAPRQRALLALLLLDANRARPSRGLIEGIWGDAVPQHPDAALQIIVSRLRRSLGTVADRLTSSPEGYRIEVADDELDLMCAQRAFARARELGALDDFTGAAAAADRALGSWSGEPLADLREVAFADAARRELHDLRFSMYEFRTRSYLRCGRHVEVLADIDAWVRLEPGRERMRAHHMVALYRAGRRVDALAVYEDLRRHLADALGVDPSTFLYDLRSRMVAQDPTLLARRAGIVAALPAWTPSGLPYVGRRREESQIFDRLREVANGGARLVLVEGEAGIGKSRLVLEVARRVDDDAIVLAVDGADALQPGLHLIANALAEASAHLSDAELALCLGRWPGDLAEIVPALRRRLPGLPLALDADHETRVARLRAAVVSWISGLSQRAP